MLRIIERLHIRILAVFCAACLVGCGDSDMKSNNLVRDQKTSIQEPDNEIEDSKALGNKLSLATEGNEDRARRVLDFFEYDVNGITSLQELAQIDGACELLKGCAVRNAMAVKLLDSTDTGEMYRYVLIVQPDFLLKRQAAVYIVVDRRISEAGVEEICKGNPNHPVIHIHRIVVSDPECGI